MMSIRRLDDVCELVMGQAPSGEAYNSDGRGWPLIAGAGDFGETTPKPTKFTTEAARLSRTGDIVLGIRASIGEKVVADGEYCLGRGVAGLRPREMLNSRFLWHWLGHAAPELTAKAKGATFKQVNKEDIGELPISLPPLQEQRRIAEVLDRTEALRAKRRAALAQLDTLTQSIFLDLFGDPVANPNRWPNPTLGGLLSFQQYGPRFYNESYSTDGIRIVRITDLDEEGNLNFSEMPRLAVSDADRKKYALRAGDLIFARTGATVGKVALIGPDAPPCIAGAYFITMRFAKTVEPTYARAVLVAPSIRAIITKLSRQAAQQNFSGPGLRKLPLPLPPIQLQRDFARRIAGQEKLKTAHRLSLAQLDSLFAVLQHRAFRREL
jgi:type I restriction enzyme, S subunit